MVTLFSPAGLRCRRHAHEEKEAKLEEEAPMPAFKRDSILLPTATHLLAFPGSMLENENKNLKSGGKKVKKLKS